ncbi:MAG: hypothetical protein R3B72_17480 [Polyangiaceae bacterium]
MLLQRRLWLKLAALSLGLTACLSPTLPLPPPDEPSSIGLGEDGLWAVRGECTPGAVVLVKNLETGVIAGTEDDDLDGRYVVRIEGQACDTAEVSQLIDRDSSDATFFVLQPVLNGVPDGTCQP